MARVFFALWPDAEIAGALHEVAMALADLAAGKPTPAEKIHLTLAFLGEVPGPRLEEVREIGSGMRGSRFAMVLDEVGAFRKSRVGWAAPSRVPSALTALQGALAAALADASFRMDERAYSPHVTLARKIAGRVPRAPMRPIEWHARDFVLAETSGGRYEIRERWVLTR